MSGDTLIIIYYYYSLIIDSTHIDLGLHNMNWVTIRYCEDRFKGYKPATVLTQVQEGEATGRD